MAIDSVVLLFLIVGGIGLLGLVLLLSLTRVFIFIGRLFEVIEVVPLTFEAIDDCVGRPGIARFCCLFGILGGVGCCVAACLAGILLVNCFTTNPPGICRLIGR